MSTRVGVPDCNDASTRTACRRAAAWSASLALAVSAAALAAPVAGAVGRPGAAAGALQVRTIFSGATIGATQPDDLTTMGGDLFAAFQNGVGPQGQASATGGRTSTVVEITTSGVLLHSWSLAGHVDGLTADPAEGAVIATVNEDADSSLFTIDPATGAVVHYHFDQSPLLHYGGTDAISIWKGMTIVSASAPGTPQGAFIGKNAPPSAPQAAYPAGYIVTLDAASKTAALDSLYSDESFAAVANAGASAGRTLKLGLTDPDASAVVPAQSPRFSGDLALDSQGDKELVFLNTPGEGRQISVLELSQSVDDLAWATSAQGTLYVTDGSEDLIDAVSGTFGSGTALVAVTPCDANSAPSTCPGPGFPAGYLGVLDLSTGHVSAAALGGRVVEPSGLLFAAA